MIATAMLSGVGCLLCTKGRKIVVFTDTLSTCNLLAKSCTAVLILRVYLFFYLGDLAFSMYLAVLAENFRVAILLIASWAIFSCLTVQIVLGMGEYLRTVRRGLRVTPFGTQPTRTQPVEGRPGFSVFRFPII